MPSTNRFGSKPGFDTSARMPPVDGSIATSAPRWSPKACSATCCSLASSVSVRLLPDTGGVRDSVRTAAPAGVDLHLLVAGVAVQLVLVALLEPGLADVVGALVVGGLLLLLEGLDVASSLMRPM